MLFFRPTGAHPSIIMHSKTYPIPCILLWQHINPSVSPLCYYRQHHQHAVPFLVLHLHPPPAHRLLTVPYRVLLKSPAPELGHSARPRSAGATYPYRLAINNPRPPAWHLATVSSLADAPTLRPFRTNLNVPWIPSNSSPLSAFWHLFRPCPPSPPPYFSLSAICAPH